MARYSSAPYDDYIDAAAARNRLDPDFLRGLFKRESGFNPNAVNPRSGATGLGQVLASTARDPGYGIAPLLDRTNPQANIDFSAAYLRARIDRAGGFDAGVRGYSGSEYGASGIRPIGRADGQQSPSTPISAAGPLMNESAAETRRLLEQGRGETGLGAAVADATGLSDWFRRIAIGLVGLIMLAVAFAALAKREGYV